MKCRNIQNLRLQSIVRDSRPHIHYAIGGTIIISGGEVLDSFPSYYELRDSVVPNSSKLQHSAMSNAALMPIKFRNLMSDKLTLTGKSLHLDPIKPCYTKESRYAE